MTKNRRITYFRGPQKKKKLDDSVEIVSSPIQGPSMLNDGILSMYRNQVGKKVQERMDTINESQSRKEVFHSNSVKNNVKKEVIDVETPEENTKNETPKTTLKTPKKKKAIAPVPNPTVTVTNPTVTITDIGGLKQEIACILDMCLHLKYPLKSSGIHPDRGLLLHGPPGCGKTLLANAIAGFIKIPLIEVQISSILNYESNDTNNLSNFFEKAFSYAPCLLFIDQIDAISGKRDTPDRNTERRMVTQLIQCFDELNSKDPASQVMVIGSTNRIDSIDPALRRGGRFDHEIALTMPDEDGRLKILQILCKDLQLLDDCDLNWLAQITPGFSGADLNSVVSGATKHARHRFFRGLAHKNDSIDDTEKVKFNSDHLSAEEVMSWYECDFKMEEECSLVYALQDFEKSIKNYIPCSKREGYPTVPNVTWNDVGALKEARDVIESSVLWPVKHKKLYDIYDMQSASGILLCGPKGCGKTLLAKAIANEAGINFLSVKGPELLNMYLGESEKSVRQCFLRARNAAPCLIFFDEIDALCSSRSSSNLNAASDRVVTQLLTEMEGVEDRKQVFIMAATNRPEKIDSAMLRPGRLDQVIFIDVPTDIERIEILRSLTRNKTRPKITELLDLKTIALDSRCSGFSGADLSYLVKEAFRCALKDYITKHQDSETNETLEICFQHFEKAFTVVSPSVSLQERRELKNSFESLKK